MAWPAASELEAEPFGEPASPHRLTDESLRSLRAELKPPPLLGRLGTLLLSCDLSLELKNLNLSSIELLLVVPLLAW